MILIATSIIVLFYLAEAKFTRKEGSTMKKILVICFLFMAIIILAKPALSFNPAAHVYIADHVFPNCADKINLYYGSVAPDLAQYTNTMKWKHDPFISTHYTYIDLRATAWGTAQKSFAKGWITHNEGWGADYFAHGTLANNYEDGYVTQKAGKLAATFDLIPEFAHFAIETAIDLRLKNEYDSTLGVKLFEANLLRSWLDRELLAKVLVFKYHETDWVTLISSELTFRDIVNQYAIALFLPEPLDKEAVIMLGVQLAEQQFGMTVDPDQLRTVLDAAIDLCDDYYENAIWPAIRRIPSSIP